MRISRTNRIAVVSFLIALLGAFGPALDGPGQGGVQPDFETTVDFDTQTFRIVARNGVAGAPAALNFVVVSGSNQYSVTVPFLLDGDGSFESLIPIQDFNNGYDLVVGIQLFTTDSTGEMWESPVWALTTRNYVVTDPNTPPCVECPTAPGGWFELVPLPGTTTPQYPHTTVAIHSAEERSGGQPMLALESGPAGSFPIN
jgi:hypothetical protein